MKSFISKFSLNHSTIDLDEVKEPVSMFNEQDSDMVIHDYGEDQKNEYVQEEYVQEEYVKKDEISPIFKRKSNNLVESVLDEGISICGSVTTTSSIKIFGFIDGDVTADGDVVVCGKVNGNIRAENVTLDNSEVTGNIFASSGVVQNKNSVVNGNIVTPLLDISGVVNGDMKISGTISIRSTAEIVGNIETRFISVFEGASISSQVNINK